MDAEGESERPIGASIGAIERQITAEKDALSHNLAELERQAKELLDWRAYARKHPLPVVGGAFAGGLLIAVMSSPRKARLDAARKAVSDELPRAARERDWTSSSPREPSAAHDAWEIFKGALAAAATTRVASYVSELLPEFSKHLEDQRRERAPHRKYWRLRSVGNGD